MTGAVLHHILNRISPSSSSDVQSPTQNVEQFLEGCRAVRVQQNENELHDVQAGVDTAHLFDAEDVVQHKNILELLMKLHHIAEDLHRRGTTPDIKVLDPDVENYAHEVIERSLKMIKDLHIDTDALVTLALQREEFISQPPPERRVAAAMAERGMGTMMFIPYMLISLSMGLVDVWSVDIHIVLLLSVLSVFHVTIIHAIITRQETVHSLTRGVTMLGIGFVVFAVMLTAYNRYVLTG